MSYTSYPSGQNGPESPYAQYGYNAPQQAPVSDKSFVATWLLSFLIGFLGADRFYLGKIGTGLVKLFTIGGLGIWWLIDWIMVLAGATRDKYGRKLAGYDQHKKIAWIITAVFVVISMITAPRGFSGGESSNFSSQAPSSSTTAPASVAPSSAEGAAPAAVSSSAPAAETSQAAETQAAETMQEAPAENPQSGAAAWAAGKFGEFETISKKGSGDTVIKLPDGVSKALVTTTYNGKGNFAVIGLDESNDSADLLVNEIGKYKGTTPLGLNSFRDVKSLQVKASGAWTVTIEPLANAKGFANKGSGDMVMLYDGPSTSLKATHQGKSNFAVMEENDELFNMGLLVNEIGNYSGTVPMSAGPSVITVKAGGAWTLATE